MYCTRQVAAKKYCNNKKPCGFGNDTNFLSVLSMHWQVATNRRWGGTPGMQQRNVGRHISDHHNLYTDRQITVRQNPGKTFQNWYWISMWRKCLQKPLWAAVAASPWWTNKSRQPKYIPIFSMPGLANFFDMYSLSLQPSNAACASSIEVQYVKRAATALIHHWLLKSLQNEFATK